MHPEQAATSRHPAEFWEHLGRAVATFGFLERVLAGAILAFTGMRPYNNNENINAAYQAWGTQLEKAVTSTLNTLADMYAAAVKNHPASVISDIDDLVTKIKDAADVRNVLCHAFWDAPDESGKSMPFYIRQRGLVIFETPIDVAYLRNVQLHTCELAAAVINTVTRMGWQFPGGSGPGVKIWS